MKDTYKSFADLERNEQSGIDYRIVVRRAMSAFAIVAPHGGGIEPGTSEIADAVAGADYSFYAFEGMKPPPGNKVLHITSTRFDEPMCLALVKRTEVVCTVHGEEGMGEGNGVIVGGLDTTLGGLVAQELTRHGFAVARHPDPRLQGR